MSSSPWFSFWALFRFWSYLYWSTRSTAFDQLCALHDFFVEYRNRSFAKADRFLRSLCQPSQHRKEYQLFLGDKEKELLAPYGETPLKTMRSLVRAMAIKSSHRIMDLGAGRGRLAIWLATEIGCEVVAVEHAPFMVERAKHASEGLSIQWCRVDLLEAPFESVDIVYFYGIGLSEKLQEALVLKIKSLKKPPQIITIGAPLSPGSDFLVLQVAPVVYSWGSTYAYLNLCLEPSVG